jgi:hypothetical protein
MVIKIKTHFFILLIFSTIVYYYSCTPKLTEKRMYKSSYISQFKLTYLRLLAAKRLNHADIIKDILETKHSEYADPILTIEDLHLIDSFTTLDNQKVKADSLVSVDRIAQGAETKQPFDYILNKLENKWIDSVSKIRYKASRLKSKSHT